MKICLEGMRVLEDNYLLALYRIEELRKRGREIAKDAAKRSLYECSIIRHGL